MPQTVFLNPPDTYQRSIDPIGHYIDQVGTHLSMQTGKPLDFCKAWIERALKEKRFPETMNPVIRYFDKQSNGDRQPAFSSLTKYIYSVVDRNEILVPTFTVYTHPSQKASLITKFVDANTKRRGAEKKAAFKAKADKDMDLFVFKNNAQTNMKLTNNSLSGAFVAKGSFINNPTAHSTLTSTTRTGTSLANASNERLIAGNRHYFDGDVVINNINSIIANTDYVSLKPSTDSFLDGLLYPTVEQTMECIEYSTENYWRDYREMSRIRHVVERLTPIQRAAFVYTGDMYHIRKYNPQYMRRFIERMSAKATVPAENALDKAYKIDEQVMILAHQICSHEAKGNGKDYKKMEELGVLGILVATAENIVQVVYEYRDFIKALFITKNMPPTVAHVREMVRRCVVISDTDSTCFTTGEWVEWMRGDMVFDDLSLAICGVITYMSTQTFMHAMALYSANINVEKVKLHTLAYKSEWTWTLLVPMNVAKHYFARAVIQEGNVFEEPELELKGVHLKNSNTPARIVEDSRDKINWIMDVVTSNQKLSLMKLLTDVATMERFISTSLLKGELEFYRQVKIKEAEAYTKDKEQSPYQHHTLWCEVFEAKYGTLEEPPYAVAKVPTILENPTALRQWLETLEDREFAERMGAWLLKKNKTAMNTFYISSNFLKAYGMPTELVPIIDTKRIILDLCNIYYLVLESVGYYKKSEMTVYELGY